MAPHTGIFSLRNSLAKQIALVCARPERRRNVCSYVRARRPKKEGKYPGGGGVDSHTKRGGDAHRTSYGLKSWVLVPLRVFKAKYLQLRTTRCLLGVPRSIEWHFIKTYAYISFHLYRYLNSLKLIVCLYVSDRYLWGVKLSLCHTQIGTY